MNEETIKRCEKKLENLFNDIEDVALYNQEKVLNAFQKNRIALRHFSGTTGYGNDDEGRDALNAVMADIFKSESAICSPLISSGTHMLSVCLFGILRPGDVAVSITGTPYDTLQDVIEGNGNGSLKDFGIHFDYVPLKDGKVDVDAVKSYLHTHKPTMVYMQRSRGYAWRKSLSVDEIGELVKTVRSCGFNGCIMLDNCYGEFVEKKEGTEVGVNILAGSMIKNPGGGIAQTGGYVCGDKKYIDLIAGRLTAPSVGGDIGSYSYGYRTMFQGIFLAPHTVMQALKGAMLFREIFNELGYETSPAINERPRDITLSIMFGDKEKLISFIQGVQFNSPIDSFVEAMPWDMPGYADKVIMAAGAFVQGASIELSADAPLREPYIAYVQGGLTYEHCKIAAKRMKF